MALAIGNIGLHSDCNVSQHYTVINPLAPTTTILLQYMDKEHVSVSCHQRSHPPEVVEAYQLQVVHHVGPPLGHQLALPAVDGLEEPLEALHAVLRQQRWVQLQNIVLKEVLVDVWVQVRLVAHELRVPVGSRTDG